MVFGFLLLDAVLLALIELFFLPGYIGTVQFPITAAVAAVTTPLLVAEAARLSPRRRIAGAPLVVWFATVLVFGAFLNAVVSFLIMAAVVYFFIVVPYTKAKERFFPAEEPGTPADVAVLEEIRDLLAARGGSTTV